MPSQYRHRRSSNPANAFPSPLEPGELAVNTANRQIALGDAAGGSVGTPLPLLAIRYFDARAQYVANDIVIQNGIAYRANGPIAPGAFNASNWTVMADPAAFVNVDGDTMTGHLVLPTGPGATNAVRKDYVDTADATLTTLAGTKVNKAGDTMTGFLTLHADPDAPMKAATKQYIDNRPPLIISDAPPATPLDSAMWWDSDTGTLYVRYNDGAGAPQWVQAVAVPAIDTSAFLVKAGDTMIGDLTLKGNPTVALHATPKQYVDAKADTTADGKFYARQGTAWVEVPRYQRVPLAGLGSVDVQVPAGAVMARISGALSMTAIAPLPYLLLQLSVAAGVFRTTPGDYQLNGFHSQSAAGGAIITTSATGTIPGMYISQAHDFLDIPISLEGLIPLRRKSTTAHFNTQFHAVGYLNSIGTFNTFYQNLLLAAAAGSALNILALRLTSSQPTILFAAESYLNVEWM